MCSGSGAGSYLRLIDSCVTQLKAQGPSRTRKESTEEEEEATTFQLYQEMLFRGESLNFKILFADGGDGARGLWCLCHSLSLSLAHTHSLSQTSPPPYTEAGLSQGSQPSELRLDTSPSWPLRHALSLEISPTRYRAWL